MNDKPKQLPPQFAKKLFLWWSKRADVEDLLGDIEEYFYQNIHTKGKLKAQFIYYHQIFSLLFSYSLVKRKKAAAYSSFYHTNSLGMINSYFKIAIRNFSKHKLFTTINIVGLAIGMSICLLALAISVSIYQSDEFHDKKNRIYQINTHIESDNESKTYASTFNAVGEYMTDNYPFIEKVVRIKSGFSPAFLHHENLISFHGYYADPSFFEVFDFKLLSGSARKALDKPFSIVLTQSAARTLFNDENPIGNTLETDNGVYTVTGVMEDLKQTHFYFEVLTSFATHAQLYPNTSQRNGWIKYRNNYVYLLLKPDVKDKTLTESLKQVSTRASGFNPDCSIQLESIGLSAVVPRWNISNALGIGWDQPSMLFFMFIGVLILLPAVFNYTNLSIARALKRAKEIGIRKVVGADKHQIRAQFIVETILLTFIALLGSVAIFIHLQNEFMQVVAAANVLDTSLSLNLVVVFFSFTLLTGLFSGIFPALYFSRMNPIQTLKGDRLSKSGKISGMKKGLFVFQFFLSLVFIIGVLSITKQYIYVFNHNHGFESDNILTINLDGINNQLAINELEAHPEVKSVTTASSLPGAFLPTVAQITPNGQDSLHVKQVFIGKDFIENFHIELIWGNSESLSNSTHNEELVLVNEQFLRAVSVFNDLQDSLSFILADGTKCRIAGIMKDFNFEPLSEYVKPLLFRYSLEASRYALLTINSTNIKKTIDELETAWQTIDQKAKFQSSFLDDEIDKAYYFLKVQIKFFSFLSAFSIVISCLGLLGMVSYSTENRTKEIAIRKIMGASDRRLYYLLTKDFLKLIIISSMIAVPVSYAFYEMLFLRFLLPNGSGLGFAEVFLGIFFMLLLGSASIYWQTSKVTKTNPAINLRYE